MLPCFCLIQVLYFNAANNFPIIQGSICLIKRLDPDANGEEDGGEHGITDSFKKSVEAIIFSYYAQC
jgi:hypothetical protein